MIRISGVKDGTRGETDLVVLLRTFVVLLHKVRPHVWLEVGRMESSHTRFGVVDGV